MAEYFKLVLKNKLLKSKREEEYYAIREDKAICLTYYGDMPTAIMRANPKHNKAYYSKKLFKEIINKPMEISALDFAQKLITAKRELINKL